MSNFCQLPYHKSKDNLTTFLEEVGATSGVQILDLNLFREVTKQIEKDLNLSYGIQGNPFIEDDLTGSQTYYTDDKIFDQIDQIRKDAGLYEDRIAGFYVNTNQTQNELSGKSQTAYQRISLKDFTKPARTDKNLILPVIGEYFFNRKSNNSEFLQFTKPSNSPGYLNFSNVFASLLDSNKSKQLLDSPFEQSWLARREFPATFTSHLALLLQNRILSKSRGLGNIPFRVVVYDPKVSGILFSKDGTINFNLYHFKTFIDNYNTVEDLIQNLESTLDEEIIHVVANRLLKPEDYIAINAELSEQEKQKVRNYYDNQDLTDKQLVDEYIRLIVQQELFGYTTEDSYRVGLVQSLKDFFKKLLNELLELYKKHPENSKLKQVVFNIKQILTESKIRDIGGFLQITPVTNKEITPELYQTCLDFVKKVNPNFRIEVLDDLVENKGVNGLIDFKNFLIQLQNGKQSALGEETSHLFFELMEDSNPLKQRMLDEITNTRIYKQTVKEYREVYGNDTRRLKSESAAKLISLYLSDKNLARKMSGSDSLWENIQRWMADFIKWIKGRPKTFSSFIESAERIVNLDTSGLHLDRASQLEEMYSLADYIEKIKILESVRNTDISKMDRIYFNLNDTLFDYSGYGRGTLTSDDKRKFLFDASRSAERDKYYQTVKLTSLGRELADKVRFIGSDKVTIYTQMYISPALETRLRNEFGNVKIERVNVTKVLESAEGEIMGEIQTNSLEEVLERDGEKRILIVDNGKPTLTKPYNIIRYNERNANYTSLETREQRETQKKRKNEITEAFLDELEKVNKTKEGSVTRKIMETSDIIRAELLDIERTEKVLAEMGEDGSELFRDKYGNLGLPLDSINNAKKLIEETDRYRDALLQFYATLEGTIGFFKERNNNNYQSTRDLIEKGDIESVEKAIYELSKITKIGTVWQEYIADFRRLIKDIPDTQTVDSLLGELDTQITRTKDIAHDLNIKVLSERLSNEFAAYNYNIEARAKELQQKIEESNGREREIYQEELDRLDRKGVEDISRILMGETPDISSLTVWIKTLYNSRDPLVGSISKLLQKAFVQVESKELKRSQEMGFKLQEVMKEHSLTNKDLEELLVVEKTPVLNSTGEYEMKDRWAYLNPWKDRHEYDEKKKPFLDSKKKFQDAKQNKDSNLKQIRESYLNEKKKFEDWETTNWYRPYIEEYYRRYDSLKSENPELFESLKTDTDLIWSDINAKSLLLKGETNPEQKKILKSEIESLRRELNQIKSEVYFDGSPKTGLDLEKAKLAQKKSEIDNEVHEWSINYKTFEQDFTIFLNTLDLENSQRETYLSLLNQENYSKLFEEIKLTAPYELIDWMNDNTIIKYSQDWYEKRKSITEQISTLSNELSEAYGQTERIDLKETWDNLLNISAPYRNEDRILDGSVTTPLVQDKVLEYETQIENIKKLVREEREGTYSPHIKALKQQLSQKIEELNEIQNKQTTDFYNDTFVELAEVSGILEEFNRVHPNLYFGYNSNLGVLINTSEFQTFIKDKDNVFTQWYHRNHLTKSYKDNLGQEHFTISPTYLWMKIEPKDSKDILTVPSYEYSQRVVKNEFQTEKENWVTWNPITYRWLPKSEQYFNPAYRKLQNSQDNKSQGLYKSLRLLTDYHLKTQETAPKEARLEFGIPYVQKRALEQSGNYIKNTLNEFFDKDNRFEEGEGNFDETAEPESKKGIKNKIISVLNGWLGKKEPDTGNVSKYTRIAVPYSHYADIERVSKDVVFTTTMFGFSTSKATKMMHTLPTFKLIEDVLQNNNFKNEKGRPINNNENRLKSILFARDHYIYGVNKQYELGDYGKSIDKTLTIIRKVNTMGSLGWPFGIANTFKNNLQGRLQNIIGSKFGNWSSNASMRKASLNLNTNFFKYISEIESPTKSLDYQIITWFNPHQLNNIAETIHRGGRKRIMQDRHIFLMNESMEFAISTNLLYGHLYHVKVKKGDEIKDLYSILKYDGTLTVEEGWKDYRTGRPIDEDYLIDTKLAHKTAAEYVQGKVADKTLLGTYTIGQAILYFKNWLIPMIRRRFDSKRENYMIGEDIEGYWRTFGRLNLMMMRDLIQDGKMYWHTFSPEEKRNYITTLNEIAFVILSSLLIGLVYGFDADDPDKYKKLKENSYAENLTLLIAIQAKAETEMLSVMPFWNVESQVVPPVLTELPKILMNPTIGFSIVNDLWKTINAGYAQITGDESAYYQINQPAYNIQKGDSKFNHYLLKVAQLDNILYSVENPEGKLMNMINLMKK